MQKKKTLIIFFSILIFILVFSGIMTFIYLKTDLLKSNKQLFFKYLIEENKMWKMISLNQEGSNNNKSYTSSGTIDFIYDYTGIQEVDNDNISNNLKRDIKDLKNIGNLSGNIKSNVDKKNKRESYTIELLKNEENIMNFEIVRDNDKYAFKSNEILKAYAGIENNNINDFLKKMNISDNEFIPSKIDFENIYKSFFELQQEDKEHIYETYKNIFIQSLDNKKYGKEKNKTININNNTYNVNLYTLSLTKAESLELFKNILQTLKQDSITLNVICNKIKMINPDSNYTDIKTVAEQIEIYIEEIEKQEKTDDEFIKIDVYSDSHAVRKVDFIFETTKQISFEYEEIDGKEYMQITQKNLIKEPTNISYNFKDAILNTKKIKIMKDEESTTYQLVFYNVKDIYRNIIDNNIEENTGETANQNNLEKIKKVYEYYETMNDEDVEISLNINLYNEKNDDRKTIIYLTIYKSKLGIEINNKKKYTDNIQNTIKLTNSNSLMLNNYPKEAIDKFFNALYNNAQKVLKKKIGL